MTPRVILAIALTYFALLAVLAAAAAFALHATQPAAFDFTALYASARLVATGRGAEVTDPVAILAVEHAVAPERVAYLNNPNLPVVSLLLSPLALLSFEAAYLAMLAVSTVALAGSALLIAAAVGPRERALMAAATVLAPPSILALAHGQTSPLVLALLLAAERVAPPVSGLLLSAAVLRPQLLPLVAVAALRDRRRLPAFLVGVAAAAVASVATAGWDGLTRYPELLRLAAVELGNNEVGLGPLVVRLGRVTGDALVVTTAVSILVLASGAVVVWRTRRGPLAIACLWSLIGSPHALLHDLLFAYPAVAAVGGRGAGLLVVAGVGAVVAQLGGVPVVPLWLVAAAVALALRGPYPRPAR